MQLRRLIARSALGDTLCGYVTCRQVLSVYKGHKWAFIEEHIHDVLGKQCRDTGNFDAALEHFAAMLNCPHSPPYWQSHYLKQFMDTIGAAGNAKVRHSMPMNTFLVHLHVAIFKSATHVHVCGPSEPLGEGIIYEHVESVVQGALPVLELPLPVVDADHVTVQCDNEICHGNSESRAQPDELWRSLEGPLLSGEHSFTLPILPLN